MTADERLFPSCAAIWLYISNQPVTGGNFECISISQRNALIPSRVIVEINEFLTRPNIHTDELSERDCTYEMPLGVTRSGRQQAGEKRKARQRKE